ncbi:MAG TPA: hypothetical protein VFF73_36010 [Planctomycetota bacterium]|nr:hypothetical protein [Planctomycetota bacterium]
MRRRVRIFDPYPELTARFRRAIKHETVEETIARLKKIGILDENGDLAPGYRMGPGEIVDGSPPAPARSTSKNRPRAKTRPAPKKRRAS